MAHPLTPRGRNHPSRENSFSTLHPTTSPLTLPWLWRGAICVFLHNKHTTAASGRQSESHMLSGGGAEEGKMLALAGSFSFLPILQPLKLQINLLRCLRKTPDSPDIDSFPAYLHTLSVMKWLSARHWEKNPDGWFFSAVPLPLALDPMCSAPLAIRGIKFKAAFRSDYIWNTSGKAEKPKPPSHPNKKQPFCFQSQDL